MSVREKEREQQTLLCAQGQSVEVRAFVDESQDVVIMWWDREVDGTWIPDRGAKIPKAGVRGLTEFLMERL